MRLCASEDEAYQIRIGHEIVAAYPEIYNPWVVDHIKRQLELRAKTRPDIAGGRSIEDIFAIATYDYWQYTGITETPGANEFGIITEVRKNADNHFIEFTR